MTPEQSIARLVRFFEGLSPKDLARIGDIYAPDARFKDPFNDVKGVRAIERVFCHMFDALDEPRFVVTGQVLQGRQCFLTWDFLFRFRRFDTARTQVVRGATHIVLDDAGQVCQHRDYWDAAEELYEKLPVVGRLMRWLKHRANS
ncbi:nuclear transport factor 2 family protein [Hydrogenophaga aquatica]